MKFVNQRSSFLLINFLGKSHAISVTSTATVSDCHSTAVTQLAVTTGNICLKQIRHDNHHFDNYMK